CSVVTKQVLGANCLEIQSFIKAPDAARQDQVGRLVNRYISCLPSKHVIDIYSAVRLQVCIAGVGQALGKVEGSGFEECTSLTVFVHRQLDYIKVLFDGSRHP